MARPNRKAKMMGGSMLSTPEREMYAEGGKLPDLTGDGKITQADVLKGRGVFQEGGEVDELLLETNAYIAAKKALASSDTPPDRKVQAQLTLDSLKSEEKGGTVDVNTYAQMMQEVDAEMAKEKKSTS